MKNTVKPLPLIFCFFALLYGCDKENPNPGNEEMLAGKTYVWEQGLPYKIATGLGGWISDDIYLSKYDTLIHSMEIQFTGNEQVSFIETQETFYSSAYRYVPVTDTDELARIPFFYPENWQEFDTVCSKMKRDTTSAHYSRDFPSIIINLNGHYNTMNSGARPDYDYKFFGWDSSFDYCGDFITLDTVVCKFPYKWNSTVDTITRVFLRKE